VKRLAAVTVVAVLGSAVPAGADRAPTQTERSAIARAAEIRAECAAIRVSTVRHRFKWAHVGIRDRCLEPRERALPRIFRRKRERGAPWRLRWDYGDGCGALLDGVPQRVLDDFGMGCAPGIRG
jgi:hypothetical protein